MGVLGTGLAAVDRGFGAPFCREDADTLVDGLLKAEKVADDSAVEEGTVWVSVGQERGHEILFSELFEDFLGFDQLLST